MPRRVGTPGVFDAAAVARPVSLTYRDPLGDIDGIRRQGTSYFTECSGPQELPRDRQVEVKWESCDFRRR